MRTIMLMAAMLPLAACATVIRGAKEKAVFESEPAGAVVTAESISDDKLGPFECVTPCEMKLKRKRDWNVVYELDGYQPAQGELRKKVTAGGVASGAGNILAGGVIGIGVDAGVGANLDLRPNPMKAILYPEGAEMTSVVLADEDADEDEDGADAAQTDEPLSD